MMEHVEVLRLNGSQSISKERKRLAAKATGCFYTHELIGKHLASAIMRICRSNSFSTRSPFRVVDPFCGDGRLVCWLIEQIVSAGLPNDFVWNVELWDYDQDALRMAELNVMELARRLGLVLEIKASKGDAFAIAEGKFGQFNIVITNPPWENIKLDRRELRWLADDEALDYSKKLKQYGGSLARLCPMAKPEKSFLSQGINLARCGTELALRLTHPRGVCGFVSPATLLADSVSVKLRRWLFQNHIVQDIAFFPAEARLFKEADQPAITLVASLGVNHMVSPIVSIYNPEKKVQREMKLSINIGGKQPVIEDSEGTIVSMFATVATMQ